MKEYKGDRSQRKSRIVEKECRTSGGQTDMTDLCCHRFESKEKQSVLNYLLDRKPVKYMIEGQETCDQTEFKELSLAALF